MEYDYSHGEFISKLYNPDFSTACTCLSENTCTWNGAFILAALFTLILG